MTRMRILGSRNVTSLVVACALAALSEPAAAQISGRAYGVLVNTPVAYQARSVVATLWDVRDRGAARMVEGIYQSLAAGRTLSAAVREAKLAAIRRGAGPEEWAAFVLVGDPDVTLPLHSPRRATPMQAGGAAAAALLLLAAYRGRKRSTADKRSPATRVSTLHS